MAMNRDCTKCGNVVAGRYSVILNTMEFQCVSCGFEWSDKPLDQIKDDDAAAYRTESNV